MGSEELQAATRYGELETNEPGISSERPNGIEAAGIKLDHSRKCQVADLRARASIRTRVIGSLCN
jgi:hypothetical protein